MSSVITGHWPPAAASMANDARVLIDDGLMYHHPDAECTVGDTGKVLSVPLVSALIYGQPCKCWTSVVSR